MRKSTTTLLTVTVLLAAAACWDLGLPSPHNDAVDGGPDGDTDADGDGDGDCDPGWAGASCEICVRYVNASASPGGDGLSWTEGHHRVRDAVEDAATAPGAPGGVCEVWVAQGTYHVYETDCTDTIPLPPNVRMYGGFSGDGHENLREQRDFASNLTLLSGQDTSETNAVYHVIRAEGWDSSAVLDGFTITGGYANGGGVESQGGGLLTYQSGILVDNCLFVGNWANEGGGAIANINGNAGIRRTRFFENSTTASGGAIYTQSGDIEVENCVFYNNEATAGGAGIYCVGDTTNTASGVWVNSTFYANSPDAAYLQDECHPNTRNCIFWQTGDPPLTYIGGAGAELTHCLIDVDGGVGNVYGDPNFADPENGDFHLNPGSACVDKAHGEGAPETDIEGVARYDWPDVDGGAGDPPYVDIGAHELTN